MQKLPPAEEEPLGAIDPAARQLEFAQMLAHDLRGSLSGVITALSALEQQPNALGEAQRASLVATALRSARLADELIGDLLAVSRRDAGKHDLELARVDLAALAADCVEHYGCEAHAKGLSLVLEVTSELPAVRADAKKLRRVFVNLVGNALKYTRRGGVTLRLVTEPGAVCVAVTDTGPGIPPEAQAHLFEKFFQVAGRKPGGLGGMGLGLAFCKQTVEAHGGRIWVVSPVAADVATGPGTTFCFTVPCA